MVHFALSGSTPPVHVSASAACPLPPHSRRRNGVMPPGAGNRRSGCSRAPCCRVEQGVAAAAAGALRAACPGENVHPVGLKASSEEKPPCARSCAARWSMRICADETGTGHDLELHSHVRTCQQRPAHARRASTKAHTTLKPCVLETLCAWDPVCLDPGHLCTSPRPGRGAEG